MAEIRSQPTNIRKTHHVSLTDGTTELGFLLCDYKGNLTPNAISQDNSPSTGLKIQQGEMKYSDFEMPYTPIVQDDWSGGFGQKYLDSDRTKFRMSYRMDTTQVNKAFLGPKETVISGIVQSQSRKDIFTDDSAKSLLGYLPLNSNDPDTPLDYGWVKFSFVAEMAFTNAIFRFIVNSQALEAEFKLSIYSDSGGAPDAELFTETKTVTTDETYGQNVRWFSNINLVAATTYWVIMRIDTNDLEFIGGLLGTTVTGSVIYEQYTNSTALPTSDWITTNNRQVSMSIMNPTDRGGQKFFEYRKSLYMVTQPDQDVAPRLFREGYHGLADSNAGALNLLKNGETYVLDELVGAIAIIVAGPGSTEPQNWRKITGNTTGGDISVEPDWNIAHTTATEYAIINTTAMHEITGHGLTKPVTSVLVANEIVYFAQGDSTNIRRMREYDNSGTWTREFHDDGSNKAIFLVRGPKTTGGDWIWRANKNTYSVSHSDVKAWGTDLSFSTAITCGDSLYRITNLIFYGNPLMPWVIKENEIGSINDDVYARVPIPEIGAVKSERNGLAAVHFGVYLFFSMLDGVERYYDGRLDDIGPNRNEGMYPKFQGNISSMTTYPGRIYASIDCNNETGKYSSILCYNGQGWHHIYGVGEKSIRDLYVQTIPAHMDRLWFCEEGEPIYIQVSLNPLKESEYEHTPLGWIDPSTITVGFRDVNKYFKSMTIYRKNSNGSPYWYMYAYKYTVTPDNGDPELLAINSLYASKEQSDFLGSVTGKELDLHLVFTEYTLDGLATARSVIEALRIESMTRIVVKKHWAFTFLIENYPVDIQGKRNATSTAKTVTDQLETWGSSESTPAPLIFRSNLDLFNSKNVVIDPASIKPLKVVFDDKTGKIIEGRFIGQLVLNEA